MAGVKTSGLMLTTHVNLENCLTSLSSAPPNESADNNSAHLSRGPDKAKPLAHFFANKKPSRSVRS